MSKLLTVSESILLDAIASNEELLEIGRLAIEAALIEFRDDRLSMPRKNGLVIRERDGKTSDVIRFGPEQALRIGLRAIAKVAMLKEARAPRSDGKCEHASPVPTCGRCISQGGHSVSGGKPAPRAEGK